VTAPNSDRPAARHEPKQSASAAPRIYVACLAAYNNGVLHGRWIDANQDPGDIWNDVNAMLAASPDTHTEEWAIHDHEGFGSLPLSEWESFERVSALAQFIGEHPDLGAHVLEHFNGDVDASRQAIDENYAGCHRSLADFAEDITCETAPPPEHLAHYVDWSSMAHDMELNGDVFTIETGFEEVHVFWGR